MICLAVQLWSARMFDSCHCSLNQFLMRFVASLMVAGSLL